MMYDDEGSVDDVAVVVAVDVDDVGGARDSSIAAAVWKIIEMMSDR